MNIDYQLEKAAFDNGFQEGAEAALNVMVQRLTEYIEPCGFSQLMLGRLRDDVKVVVLAQRAKREDEE